MLVFVRASRYDAGTGQFTQQDPIGIAGGANVYGFAGGDPVNYDDPFGLKIHPRYSALIQSIISHAIKNSPGFARIWGALARADRGDAEVFVVFTTQDVIWRESKRQSSVGAAVCTSNTMCIVYVAEDTRPEQVIHRLTHELLHAAGYLERNLSKKDKTGVSASCTYDQTFDQGGCWDRLNSIEAEARRTFDDWWATNKKREGSKEAKP